MTPESKAAAEIVIQQMKLHQQLMIRHENGEQREAAYDYQRWITKTEELLKQDVSVEEAKRFYGVVHQARNVFRYHENDELHLFYESVQAFLNSLIGGIVDNQIEVNPAALQAKRRSVLYRLYDMAPNDKLGDVVVSDLANALGMQYHEANRILQYWKVKGMVRDGWSDESVGLEPHAIDEIEESRRTGRETKHIPATTIYYSDNRISIGGDNTGQVQAGNQSSQTMHSPISEILPKLAEFIETVRQADFLDRDDAVRDLEKVQELANTKQTEGTWQRIHTKLTAAKTTMEIAGFIFKTHPYWPLIWDYFHNTPK